MANWVQNLRTENAAILALTTIPHAEVTAPKKKDFGYDFEVTFRDLPSAGAALTVEVKGVDMMPHPGQTYRPKLTPKTKQFVRAAKMPVMLMVVYLPRTEFFVSWLKLPMRNGKLVLVRADEGVLLTKATENVLRQYADDVKAFWRQNAA